MFDRLKKIVGLETEAQKKERYRQDAINRLTDPDASLNTVEQANALAWQGDFGEEEQQKQRQYMKDIYNYPEEDDE